MVKYLPRLPTINYQFANEIARFSILGLIYDANRNYIQDYGRTPDSGGLTNYGLAANLLVAAGTAALLSVVGNWTVFPILRAISNITRSTGAYIDSKLERLVGEWRANIFQLAFTNVLLATAAALAAAANWFIPAENGDYVFPTTTKNILFFTSFAVPVAVIVDSVVAAVNLKVINTELPTARAGYQQVPADDTHNPTATPMAATGSSTSAEEQGRETASRA